MRLSERMRRGYGGGEADDIASVEALEQERDAALARAEKAEAATAAMRKVLKRIVHGQAGDLLCICDGNDADKHSCLALAAERALAGGG